jgi:hypothetical protein
MIVTNSRIGSGEMLIHLNQPSLRSCAGCKHWATASQVAGGAARQVPPEHIYCSELGLDMEPYRGWRATMVRCVFYRAQVGEVEESEVMSY